MVHETKLASVEDEIEVVDDDEIEEINMTQNKTVSRQVMEKFANTRIGQMMIVRMDRVLKVVEDTAKWSLPQDNNELQLERPLPWIFFLTMIIWLRVLRIWLSLGAHIVGAQPVTPHTIVYYMQTKRRHLRAIRIQGLKSIRSREIETTIMFTSNSNVTFMGKLRNLFSRAICKPGQYNEVPVRRVFVQDGKLAQNSYVRSTKRPRDDSIDPNLTVDEMLKNYANEDSDNDSDYIPKEDEEYGLSTTSHSSSLSDEEPENKTADMYSSTSENYKKSLEQNKDQTKENCEVKYRPKPKAPDEQPQTYHFQPAADTDNEPMHTPKETTDTNGTTEESKTSEMPVATAEVASSQTSLNTPKTTQSYLTVEHMEENKQKSTPGHETAASLKPSITNVTSSVPLNQHCKRVEDKYHRTVTTQTAIELDWTITIKTEITHTKHYPKLEKLNCSVSLTPASSTEDIFYSPSGLFELFFKWGYINCIPKFVLLTLSYFVYNPFALICSLIYLLAYYH